MLRANLVEQTSAALFAPMLGSSMAAKTSQRNDLRDGLRGQS
jgi:hypothetical protein